MATGVITWSQTAASNGTADTSVNFAEGMAPSAVNDSARALMSSVAKWRDDLNGSITTGGTSTAYTVTSNQVEAALTANYLVAFTPHATNGATCTLNVDGLGAKPLRSAPATELPDGVLIEGTPYVATYYTTNSGEWIVHHIPGPTMGKFLGEISMYGAATAPNSSFAFGYGQAISRTTYAGLFAVYGTTHGSGDGSTTFNLPDFRSRAPFGYDGMGGGAATGRLTTTYGLDATTLGAVGGAQSQTLTTAQLPVITPAGSIAVSAQPTASTSVSVQPSVSVTGNPTFTGNPHTHATTSSTAYAGNNSTFFANGSGSTNVPAGIVTMSGINTGSATPSGSISGGTYALSGGSYATSLSGGSYTFTGTSFGSGSAHSIVPPGIIVTFLVRVL